MNSFPAYTTKGDMVSQHNLATMYYKGDGVNQDFEKAFTLTKYVAERGYAPSQYNLGHMYMNGEGVEQNSTIGVQWIIKAARQGHSEAQRMLKDIKNQIIQTPV